MMRDERKTHWKTVKQLNHFLPFIEIITTIWNSSHENQSLPTLHQPPLKSGLRETGFYVHPQTDMEFISQRMTMCDIVKLRHILAFKFLTNWSMGGPNDFRRVARENNSEKRRFCAG